MDVIETVDALFEEVFISIKACKTDEDIKKILHCLKLSILCSTSQNSYINTDDILRSMEMKNISFY